MQQLLICLLQIMMEYEWGAALPPSELSEDKRKLHCWRVLAIHAQKWTTVSALSAKFIGKIYVYKTTGNESLFIILQRDWGNFEH